MKKAKTLMLLLIVLTLVCGCSFGAFAADYTLYLDGKGVAHQNTAAGTAVTVNGLSYSGGKWIMNGVNFSTTQPVALIIADNATVEIAKSSQNIIASTNTDISQKDSIAVKALGTLTLSGSGTLALTSGKAEQSFALYSTGSLILKDISNLQLISESAVNFSYGIYVANGNATVSGSEIIVQSGDAGKVSAAISVLNRTSDNKQFNADALTVTDSNLFVKSGNVVSAASDVVAASYGIYINNGNVIFNDSCEISAYSGSISLTQSYGPAYAMGICIAPDNKLGTLTAKGSTEVFAQGEKVEINTAAIPADKTATAQSAGIAVYGDIASDCTKIMGIGGDSSLRSDGIYSAGGTVTVAGGTVKGIAGNHAASGSGIYGKGGFSATAGYTVGICFDNESGIAGDKISVASTMAISSPSGATVKDGKVYQGTALAKKVNISTKCTGNKNCPAYKFTDVDKTAWYHYDVDFAVSRQLTSGTSTTTFSPAEATTREQLVTLLYRMAGEPSVTGTAPFSDLTSEWSKNAIIWASTKGIVSGYGDKTFRPQNAVTRQEMAVILYRYANANTPSAYDTSLKASIDAYPDKDDVGTWATDAMQWAIANSILSGSAENGVSYLRPNGSTTRAQIAAVLHRFHDRYIY